MTIGESFPAGNDTAEFPTHYIIGETTERWRCAGCGRHLMVSMRSFFTPDVCVSCSIGVRRRDAKRQAAEADAEPVEVAA